MMRPALAVILAASLALGACQPKLQRPPCPAGEVCLEYGNEIDPVTLDPQKANLTREGAIIADLMMGLTTEAADASLLPGVAESWTTSADGLVWTFHLRDSTWSDGTPVTADDFVYAYRRILNPKTASIYAYIVHVLKNGQAVGEGKADPTSLGATAIDARTLRLELEHPAPYLPQLLSHQSFFPVPKHVVERYGDDWVQPGKYVSNGAYTLVSWRLGDRIEARKNPRFWDAGQVCVDRIRYYPTTDSVSAERRVQRGELDLNTTFQSNRVTRLRKVMGAQVRTHVWLSTAYLSFNTRDVASLKDARVRRALSQSIDREFITGKLLRAGQVAAYAFVPPVIANYEPGPRTAWVGMSFEDRQAGARRLLAEAGYGPTNPLKIVIKSPNSNDTLLILEAVQADWRAIGVDVSLQQNESQIAFAAYRARDFEVGSMSWVADFNDPINFLQLMHSQTGAQNYGDYKNPDYDALLARADNEPDGAKRAKILAEAEQLMLNADALAPIYYGVNRALVREAVTGWVDNAENIHRARWLCKKGHS
jgi:oligopeptide transport system substrate-binding protein